MSEEKTKHVTSDKEWFRFVPEWNGNADYDDPISMDIKFLDNKAVTYYANKVKRKVGRGGREETNYAEVTKRQFLDSVRNVHFWYGEEPQERIVTDVAEFWDLIEFDLRQEIMDAMECKQTLSENEKKHARSGSTSRPVPQRIENRGTSGIVPPASMKAGT